VVMRERVSEAKEAEGRKLIDVPGYTFRIFVTNQIYTDHTDGMSSRIFDGARTCCDVPD
jgi:hypothetical protein